MKKRVAIVMLAAIFLGACQSKNEETTQATSSSIVSSTASEVSESASSSSELQESSVSSSSTEAVKDTYWNAEKDQKLSEFMSSWGQRMNQTYKQYSPGHNVDLYGLQLPDEVLTRTKFQVAIGQTPIVLNWSGDGVVDSGYALVAVYSDADTQPYLAKHVYFFTINSGIPKVLVTTQNQGNGDNYLYFSETENVELKEGFKSIVDSQVAYDNVKANFTRDEQLSYFVNNYGQLPYAGSLRVDNTGTGLRVIYTINEGIISEKPSIVAAIDNVRAISIAVKQNVGAGIPVSLQEPQESGYTLTMTDGQATQANHLFGRIIQGIE